MPATIVPTRNCLMYRQNIPQEISKFCRPASATGQILPADGAPRNGTKRRGFPAPPDPTELRPSPLRSGSATPPPTGPPPTVSPTRSAAAHRADRPPAGDLAAASAGALPAMPGHSTMPRYCLPMVRPGPPDTGRRRGEALPADEFPPGCAAVRAAQRQPQDRRPVSAASGIASASPITTGSIHNASEGETAQATPPSSTPSTVCRR